jgi:hypothetical protein
MKLDGGRLLTVLFSLSFIMYCGNLSAEVQEGYSVLDPGHRIEENPFFKQLASEMDRADLVEKTKIAFLIHAIKKSPYAFIRNGVPYNGVRAASHMLLKYKNKFDKISNVAQFIEYIASRSSLTGEPYTVRLPDGSTQAVSELFAQEIAQLDSQLKAVSSSVN